MNRSIKAKVFSWGFAGSALLIACEAEPVLPGRDEPIVAAQADFKKGKLTSAKADAALPEDAPAVTSLVYEGGGFVGAAAMRVGGHVNEHASSVGFRLRGEGTGYWSTVVGGVDIDTPGWHTWGTTVSISADLTPGRYELVAVPFNEQGDVGKEASVPLCIGPDFPDRGNTCDPKKKPPAALAILRWNQDADLDLSVVSPAKVRYDRNLFSQVVDGDVVAELDGDRASACLLDGRRSEAFVWYEQPPTGNWYVYANLFDSCAASSVQYELTVYRRKDNKDGTWSLREEKAFGGEFLRQQTQTSSADPLYLTSVKFP